jgi:hypothetical protein
VQGLPAQVGAENPTIKTATSAISTCAGSYIKHSTR